MKSGLAALVTVVIFIRVVGLAAAVPVNYWQQEVAYLIEVTLDTEAHTLSGHEIASYRNNSPDTLTYVWFHLYPNAYKAGSLVDRDLKKAGLQGPGSWTPKDRGYIQITSLSMQGSELERGFKPGDETELRVELVQPLEPGRSIEFDMDFLVKIPRATGSMAQRMQYKDRHYEISQWYPKVVVYDAAGWHPDGYRLQGEFYGEFGTFDVAITLPENMTVASTGDLAGPPGEVARMDSLARLGARLDSLRAAKAKTQMENILKSMKREKLSTQTKTITYHAENVHDFAWAADKDFILKRGRYKDVTLNVFVRPRHEKHGKEALQFTHDALEHYGRHYGEYPYRQMSVVEGDFGGGMEYPNLTIVGFDWPGMPRMRELVIIHETGHNWFYGMLGSNEMAEAWLDEGINSFAENRYLEEKYGRQGNLTKWPTGLGFLPPISDRYYQTLEYYLVAANQAEEPILTPACQFRDMVAYVGVTYGKGAWVVDMLRTYLGDEAFDAVMQAYFREYKFKHPTVRDFIEVAERVSGRQLDWFFAQWLGTTGQCDLRIEEVAEKRVPITEGLSRRLTVRVSQEAECRMPAELVVKTKDGEEHWRHWGASGRDTTFVLTVAESPSYVWIDPHDRILEVDNWNNRKPRKVNIRPIADLPSFDSYQVFYGPGLWYDNDVDGWRPGVWLNGGQFRTLGPLKGSREWTAGASYGTESHKVNYRFSLRHPVGRLGRFTRLEAGLKDLEGKIDAKVGLRWRRSEYILGSPEWVIGTYLFLQSVYDLDYLDLHDWSKGRVVGGLLDLRYSTFYARHPVTCALHLKGTHKSLQSDFDFVRSWFEIRWDARWINRIRTNLRLFGGYLDGIPPKQERFYLSGGLIPTGPLAFVPDGRGRYAPQNYYHVPGDANLRGYYARHLAGNVAASLNLWVCVPYLPARIFYGLGNVWDQMDDVSWGSLRQDAGISFYLGPLGIHFPLWISDPLPGECKFEYRWLVGLETGLSPF